MKKQDFSDALIKEYLFDADYLPDEDDETPCYYIVKVRGDGDCGDVFYLGTDREDAIQAVDDCYPRWLNAGAGGGDSAPAVYEYCGSDKTFINAVLRHDEKAAITFFYKNEWRFNEIYTGDDTEGVYVPENIDEITPLKHIVNLVKAAGCTDININIDQEDGTVSVTIKDIYKLDPAQLRKALEVTLIALSDYQYIDGGIYAEVTLGSSASTEIGFNGDPDGCTKQELIDELVESQEWLEEWS